VAEQTVETGIQLLEVANHLLMALLLLVVAAETEAKVVVT
jgi:hypothetical protein